MFVSRAEAEGTPLSDALQRYLAEITPTKKATTIARERNRVKVLMDLPLSRRSLASIKGSDIALIKSPRPIKWNGGNPSRFFDVNVQ